MTAKDRNERPPVEGVEPPKALTQVVNPVMKALLRSPLHGLVSKQHATRL